MPRKRLSESQKALGILLHSSSKGGKIRQPWEGKREPPPTEGEIELALAKKSRSRSKKPKKIGGHITARYGGHKTR